MQVLSVCLSVWQEGRKEGRKEGIDKQRRSRRVSADDVTPSAEGRSTTVIGRRCHFYLKSNCCNEILSSCNEVEPRAQLRVDVETEKTALKSL